MTVPPECPLGIDDVVGLFDECRRRTAEDGRDLPVIALLGRRGSGKSATLAWLGHVASRRPNAYYDFRSSAPKRPYEVAARLALGLSRQLKWQPTVRFPRLTLGLLVVHTGLTLNSADARRVRAELKRALRRARQDDDTQAGVRQASEAVGLLTDLNLLPLAGLGLVLNLVQAVRPLLPLRVLWRTGLPWYGDGPNPAVDALVRLNEQAHSEHPADRAAVDRRLCEAFLADLRAHYARRLIRHARRSARDRECVVLLDNIDAPRGREFLDLLVRIRDAHAAPGSRHAPHQRHDPLLVVATAADARAVPGPYAVGHPAELHIRTPEEASYEDWRRSVPRPATTTKWRWYPVRLRDLTEPEVTRLAEATTAAPAGVPQLVHRLSYGHPWSVRRLLEAAHEIGAERGDAVGLRHILAFDVPVPDAPDAPDTTQAADRQDVPGGPGAPSAPPDGSVALDEAARRYLLRDLTEGQRGALVVCSAARAFESAVDAGVLAEYDPHTQNTLHREIDARLWLTSPVPEDAGTRGGHGSGYLDHCAQGGRPAAVLQPWLRLVLLETLARGAPDAPSGWDTVHRALRDWHRGQPQTDRHRLDVLYHTLALRELDATVAHLAERFDTAPSTEHWLYELYAVTAAPLRTAVPPRDAQGPTPSDRVRGLAEELAPVSYREHCPLTMLVTALWLATDPRNRTGGVTPELNPTIRAMFQVLAARPHSRATGLLNEAERYDRRP